MANRRMFEDFDFESDYRERYGSTGRGYDFYEPAYRYGYELSGDENYRGKEWARMEDDVRRGWEARGEQGAWEDVKDAVRRGWENVKDAFD